MGGVCTKEELEGSAFIKINSREIGTKGLSSNISLPHGQKEEDLLNLSPLSSNVQEFKSSSYNLFDLQGFLLPDTEETLLPLTNSKNIVGKKSPIIEYKQRRRSSEISVLQLPLEKNERSKSNSNKNPRLSPNVARRRRLGNLKGTLKRPTFSKAPSSPEKTKILHPPRFKAIKRSRNPKCASSLSKKDDGQSSPSGKKGPSAESSLIAKKKAPPRKTFSYRTVDKKSLSQNLSSKSTDDSKGLEEEKKPLLLKDPSPVMPKKLVSKKSPAFRRKTLKAKESPYLTVEPTPKIVNKNNSSSSEWLTISLEKSPSPLANKKKRNNYQSVNRVNRLMVKSSSDPNLSLAQSHSIRGRRGEKPRLLSKESSVNGGLDKPFTNISYIKSATHSVESNVSNFERRTKIESFPDKKTTLNEAGLGKELKLTNKFTPKDFKQKKEAYNEAMKQLESGIWEKEIEGINSIVSLVKSNPEIIKSNISMVVRLLAAAVKNLRSQVCRSGAQAFAELYVHAGRSMEGESDKIIPLLLNKAVDTNKFIREDCNTALDIAMENISVFKGLSALLESGVDHKNVVARINTSRIFSNIIRTMGAEKVMGSSKEFQTLVFVKGCALLGDGSQEVRNHTKEAFKELASHKNYASNLKKLVPETSRRYIQKSLDSIQINV